MTPQAIELEKVVIGAMLLDPEAITEVIDILTPESFCESLHAQAFAIIRQMYDAGQPIDLYTVGQRCNAVPKLKEAKILPYLTGCTTKVGSGAHIAAHARIIHQKAVARQLITLGHQLVAKASDNDDIDEVLDFLSRQADNVNSLSVGGTARHIGDILPKALKAAEERQIRYQQGETPGITTGLTGLDKLTGGWCGGQLIVIGARPSMGKSALALHLAISAARSGNAAAIFSLEMTGESLVNRLILSECSVEADAFRAGRIAGDWPKLEQAASNLRGLPIFIDDSSQVNMRHIRARSKILKKRGQCDIAIIDYLQLQSMDDKSAKNREQEVAAASRACKLLAKELDIPVILLSQLSRAVESRGDRMPQLSDLRESGAIEQDADIVAFLYRPAYYGIEVYETTQGSFPTQGLGLISIAKNRDGSIGQTAFSHNPAMAKITDYHAGQPQHDKEPF